jgi:uncharacterized protein YcbK (DUF882 family)
MRYLPPPLRPPSAHFNWGEVIGNGRSGYPKVPLGPFKLPNGKWVFPRTRARVHAANMEKLRTRVNLRREMHNLPATGINVLSWARSWEHNRAVGGAADSQHLYFGACDISLQEIERLYPWRGGTKDFDIDANTIFATGGLGQYPGGNRHVDSRGYRARWTSWVPGR